MMLRSYVSPVDGALRRIRCVAGLESKAPAFDLDNFIVRCRTAFGDIYEKQEFYERKVLPCTNPTLAKNALEILVFQWCSESQESPQQPCVNRIVSSIMKESHRGVIIVGVVFIVGYVYENQSFYKLPLFKVYRSEWDEEPIIVDANALVYTSLADCLSAINLPDSFICLPRDGVLQFDHCSNQLPLEFYAKNRSSPHLNRLWLFAGVLGASEMALAYLKLRGPELSELLLAAKWKTQKILLIVFDFVKVNVTVENFIILVKYALLFLIMKWTNGCTESFAMDILLRELPSLLFKETNVRIDKDNENLIQVFVFSILETFYCFENFDKIKNFLSDIQNLNLDFNFVRSICFSHAGMKILCKLVNVTLEAVFEGLDLDETTKENLNLAFDAVRPFHAALVHLHSILRLGGKISVSKIFRTTFHMFKNFVNRKVVSPNPSEQMRRIIELMGSDYTLSTFLSVTGLQDGELREEGEECLEGVDAGEDAEEFVHVFTDSEGKCLLLVEGPMEEAVIVARTRLQIPHNVPFERKHQNSGLFHGVPGKNVILFNCVYDNINFTYIYQKPVRKESWPPSDV